MPTLPSYRHFKPRNLGFVEIAGKRHYLGPYGSEASIEAYKRLMEGLKLERETKAATKAIASGTETSDVVCVNELMVAFLEHADGYYVKAGAPTGTPAFLRIILRSVKQMFGRELVNDFGPLKLKAIREAWIKEGRARSYINDGIQRIRSMFRWGVENELVPVAVYQALAAVAGLKKGRSAAREPEPIMPVPQDVVDATLPCLPRIVADMVRLQLLAGMRPGEVCSLRPADITRTTDGVLCYRPEHHKTEHHGRERRIYFGPKAAAILAPYLGRDPDVFCFSPRDVVAEQVIDKRRRRKSKVQPSQINRSKPNARPRRERYSKDSYNRAIARAVAKANEKRQEPLPSWSPNQLRHTRATELRAAFGIEGAQTVLGHSDPKTTLVYAERDFEKARKIMSEVG